MSPHSQKQGFTVMEVLCAVALIVTLLGIGVKLVRDSALATERSTRASEANRMALNALNILHRDLESAVADSTLTMKVSQSNIDFAITFDSTNSLIVVTNLFTNSLTVKMETDEEATSAVFSVTSSNMAILCWANPHDSAPRALHAVWYWLEHATQGLCNLRRVQLPLAPATDPTAVPYTDTNWFTSTPTNEGDVICRNVVTFTLNACDAQGLPCAMTSPIPSAIDIRLETMDRSAKGICDTNAPIQVHLTRIHFANREGYRER